MIPISVSNNEDHEDRRGENNGGMDNLLISPRKIIPPEQNRNWNNFTPDQRGSGSPIRKHLDRLKIYSDANLESIRKLGRVVIFSQPSIREEELDDSDIDEDIKFEKDDMVSKFIENEDYSVNSNDLKFIHKKSY